MVQRHGGGVGNGTSCAVDAEGYLTGQAYVEVKSAERGSILYIYQGAPKEVGKALGTMKAGDRVLLPSPVHVVRRFPKMK